MHHKNSIISILLMSGFLALSLVACESPQPPYPDDSTTTTTARPAPPVPTPAASTAPSLPPPQPPEPQPQRARRPFQTGAPRGTADVHFSAYYPHRISTTQPRYALIVYAHLAELLAILEADAQKFTPELGGSVPTPTAAPQSARLSPDTPITVTPTCDGLTFDPVSLTKTWDGSWVRFNFDFKPLTQPQAKTLTGRIAISLALIEIAHIDFSIEVEGKAAAESNPLALAKRGRSAAKLYQKIFVSYSRRDKEVVQSYRAAQIALGNDVFMDTESIRSGQNWQATLAQAIDNADIFQLFWSKNSAGSENVRHEWDYALRYRCPETQCAEFVRPVYWHNPLTLPPTELGHLNFRYVPVQEQGTFFDRLCKLFGSGE